MIMENIFNRIARPDFFTQNNCTKSGTLNQKELLAELKKVRMQIACAQTFFDNECDFDMIDACVFELESLNARHRYLMRLIRESGVSVDVIDIPAV